MVEKRRRQLSPLLSFPPLALRAIIIPRHTSFNLLSRRAENLEMPVDLQLCRFLAIACLAKCDFHDLCTLDEMFNFKCARCNFAVIYYRINTLTTKFAYNFGSSTFLYFYTRNNIFHLVTHFIYLRRVVLPSPLNHPTNFN